MLKPITHLHLSQILNGLNRAECGGPHTKARRGKHLNIGKKKLLLKVKKLKTDFTRCVVILL